MKAPVETKLIKFEVGLKDGDVELEALVDYIPIAKPDGIEEIIGKKLYSMFFEKGSLDVELGDIANFLSQSSKDVKEIIDFEFAKKGITILSVQVMYTKDFVQKVRSYRNSKRNREAFANV